MPIDIPLPNNLASFRESYIPADPGFNNLNITLTEAIPPPIGRFDERDEIPCSTAVTNSYNNIPLNVILQELISKVAELEVEVTRLRDLYEGIIDTELERIANDNSCTS